MKIRLIGASLGLLWAIISIPAFAADDDGAVAYIKTLADSVVAVFKAEKPSDERRKIFSEMIAKNLDVDSLLPFAMGSSWQDATDNQKAALKEAFREHAARAYTKFLLESFIIQYKVVHVSSGEDSKTMVSTKVERQYNDRAPTYNWTIIHYNDGKYKVFDVAEAGMGLSGLLKQECESQIQKSGINGLISYLKQPS
ncbi:MAG: ABC transporter substrate-binding protein [Alphaproteobacteria bacterium]